MDLKTFGEDGRIMYWGAVNDRVKLYCNEGVLSWYSAMLETERKSCFGFCFVFIFILPFLGISYTYIFFLRLSNGKHL